MKKLLSFLITSLIAFVSSAQDQHLVDSLQAALKTSKQDTVRANILNALFANCYYTDPGKAMEYGKEMLQLSEQIGFRKGVGTAYNCIGVVHYIKGDYFLALDFYKKSLEIKLELNNKTGASSTYANIGIIYAMQGNFPEALKNNFSALKLREETGIKKDIADSYISLGNIYMLLHNTSEALKYQLKALSIKKEIGDKLGLAHSYANIGNIYIDQDNYNEALLNYLESLKILEELGDKKDMATVYSSIGLIYYRQGNYSESLKNSFTAIKISEESGSIEGIPGFYNSIANCYREQKKYAEASDYYNKALALAKEMGSLEISKSSYEGLTKLDSAQGNFKQSLEHYKLFIAARDSMFNEESTKKNVQQQMQYDFDKKESLTRSEQEKKDVIAQKELQKQKLVRNGFIGGFTVVLLFAGVFFTQRNKIKKGKKRSDELLLNILPGEVANELKEKGSAAAKQFDEVTVMFTDFKGFTQISEKLSPAELVAEIHHCFKTFDDIISRHNIEKIKTIGDSYMCAGGLPVVNKTNATDVIRAALEIQQFMQKHLQHKKSENKEPFEIRIGIHTGPVVAGIVGVKKFAYDIWGDTVNIASRMESSGEAGKVNISGNTYELVKDKFNCIHRGKIQAKNKGEIDMYFVEIELPK